VQDGLGSVLDYSDYLAAPEDGKRYEIVGGNLLVTPAPRPLHQRVLLRLATALRDHFRDRHAGEIFVAPIDLILSEHDVLQPDLLVVDDRTTITDRGIEGAPLLVVEILSQATAGRDRGVKARRYAEFGIRHYWLVDPDARRVECHRLAGYDYELSAAADGDATLTAPGFAGLTLPLGVFWADSEAPTRS
jgi:Uma2 family endonuclease